MDINIFPDGMMEDAIVNAACWDNDPPWDQTLCALTKNSAAPHTGVQNLRSTTTAVTTASYCYGLFPSQTPGIPGGSFMINNFSCWIKTDVGNSIQLTLTHADSSTTVATQSSLTWQQVSFSGPIDLLREGPNGEAVLRVKGIHPAILGEWVEIDDIQARENYIAASSSKGFPDGYACWNCDKFQPTDPALYRTGECRALPPRRCCETTRGEPIFGKFILDASAQWCAAWKRNTGASLPDPPPFL